MQQTILSLRLSLLALLLLSTGTIASAQHWTRPTLELSSFELQQTETQLSVRGNQIRVQNAEGELLEIYNITGIRIASHRIDSEDKTITLHEPRGIYILKVGKLARRINL